MPSFTETAPGILSFVHVYGIQLQHLNPELREDQKDVVGNGSSGPSLHHHHRLKPVDVRNVTHRSPNDGFRKPRCFRLREGDRQYGR